MIDRLRALLDRPLDPSAARAILAFASAILVGVAGLFVLAASQPDQPTSSSGNPSVAAAPPSPVLPTQAVEGNPAEGQATPHRQDPQDIKGSGAANRAARALRSHRALQHVPYRDGELRIDLVGARGGRAVLRVTGPTVRETRRGWRRFLRRYRDSGRAYLPLFRSGESRRRRGS